MSMSGLQNPGMIPRGFGGGAGFPMVGAHNAHMSAFAQQLPLPQLSHQQSTMQQQQNQQSQQGMHTPQMAHQAVHGGLQSSLQGAMASPQISTLAGTLIREVWKSNFEQEMHVLRELVERYNYISLVCAACRSKIRV